MAILAGAGLLSVAEAVPTTERVYLSGKGPSDAVEWDFYCSSGRRSGEWTTIPVPSNWEQHGFGGYDYGHVPADEKHDEIGTYRTRFMVPEGWKDQHVRLVFEGSMTETSIRINGESLGAPNLGGYLPFRFILDQRHLHYGSENMLEVVVKKKPENRSLDLAERKADYWVFGGIYRPVYLEVQPKAFVNRVAIDARADGDFRMDVFPQVHRDMHFRNEMVTHVDAVRAQIQTRDGRDVGNPMIAPIHGATGRVHLATRIENAELWSPEHPTLYQVRVTLLHDGTPVFERLESFGFRSFELKPEDGLYLNGKKMLIRGINRNVFAPKTARAIDPQKAWADARAIKAMNANLVRSHLPASAAFMEACDALGLFVIVELCNWQAPSIDTPIARNIASELVTFYQNHPSVIFWANGNEGGFNLEIDEVYHLYDLQDRPVIHPWSYHEGLDTLHYPTFAVLTKKLEGPRIYLPTEFLHGLYDGGHGAGMEDYWNAIRSSPFGAGGVLWCWGDAAIERTDASGKLDTYGNCSADGIVGPHGEKEGSYFTVREVWSPVQIPMDHLSAEFDGKLPMENRFDDTSLRDCVFAWRLLNVSTPFSRKAETTVHAEGSVTGPDVPPGAFGHLQIPLTTDWQSTDALEVTAISPSGREIMKWSWPIHSSERASESERGKRVPKPRVGHPFEIASGDALWSFDPQTGQLLGCTIEGKDAGLRAGPVLYAGNPNGAIEFSGEWRATVSRKVDTVVIESENSSNGSRFSWTLSSDGSVTLDYAFAAVDEELTSCAVGFDLDEAKVASKRWLGNGPFRIWANRVAGPQYGLWENDYNEGLAGVNWALPEFSGIFGDVDWMRVDLKSGVALVLDTAPGSAVGILRPRNAVGPDGTADAFYGPKRAIWDYPRGGGLHLFHKLPAVGTKFKDADQLGPQSLPQKLSGAVSGRVVFLVR